MRSKLVNPSCDCALKETTPCGCAQEESQRLQNDAVQSAIAAQVQQVAATLIAAQSQASNAAAPSSTGPALAPHSTTTDAAVLRVPSSGKKAFAFSASEVTGATEAPCECPPKPCLAEHPEQCPKPPAHCDCDAIMKLRAEAPKRKFNLASAMDDQEYEDEEHPLVQLPDGYYERPERSHMIVIRKHSKDVQAERTPEEIKRQEVIQAKKDAKKLILQKKLEMERELLQKAQEQRSKIPEEPVEPDVFPLTTREREAAASVKSNSANLNSVVQGISKIAQQLDKEIQDIKAEQEKWSKERLEAAIKFTSEDVDKMTQNIDKAQLSRIEFMKKMAEDTIQQGKDESQTKALQEQELKSLKASHEHDEKAYEKARVASIEKLEEESRKKQEHIRAQVDEADQKTRIASDAVAENKQKSEKDAANSKAIREAAQETIKEMKAQQQAVASKDKQIADALEAEQKKIASELKAEEDEKTKRTEEMSKAKAVEEKSKQLSSQLAQESTKKNEISQQKEEAEKLSKDLNAANLRQQMLIDAKEKDEFKEEEELAKAIGPAPRSTTGIRISKGYLPFGATYGGPNWIRDGGVCWLSGLVRVDSPQERPLIATLPAHCRPHRRRIFNTVLVDNTVARIDVDRQGAVRFVSDFNKPTYVSLDGIGFASQGSNLRLASLIPPWTNYGKSFAGASYFKEGELCVVSGMVRLPSLENWQQITAKPAPVSNNTNASDASRIANNMVLTLPSDCAPAGGKAAYILNHNGKTVTITVTRLGEVVFSGGDTSFPWLSLDGIAFINGVAPQPLNLSNSVANAYATFRIGAYYVSDTTCVLSGSIKGVVNPNEPLGFLPPECRPVERLVFSVAHGNDPARVDVKPDGALVWMHAKASSQQISLDSIRFYVAPANLSESALRDNAQASRDRRAVEEEQTKRDLALQQSLDAMPQSATLNLTGFWTNPPMPDSQPAMLPDGRVPEKVINNLYAQPTITVLGRLCALGGAVLSDRIAETVSLLPSRCRPVESLRAHRALNSAGLGLGLGVSSNGTVGRETGARQGSNMISLDGIIFPASLSSIKRRSVKLAEGWKSGEEDKLPKPAFAVEGDVCFLSGAVIAESQDNWVKNSSFNLIGKLPQDCAPLDGDVLFPVNHGDYVQLIRVKSDGSIFWEGGARQSSIVLLDGIAFYNSRTNDSIPLRPSLTYNNVGKGYRPISYYKQGALCMLSGVITGNGDSLIATLPRECRPVGGQRSFTVAKDESAIVLHVTEEGKVTWAAESSVRKPGRISMDGITFVIDEKFVKELERQSQNLRNEILNAVPKSFLLPLSRAYTPFQPSGPDRGTFQIAHGSVLGRFCFLSGMVRSMNVTNRVVCELPPQCRPAKQRIFAALLSGTSPRTARVEVFTNGTVAWSAGSNVDPRDPRLMMSFDGIGFLASPSETSSEPGNAITLRAPWSNRGKPYATASFVLEGDICYLYGAVRADDWTISRVIGRLPVNCRPRGRLVFNANQNQWTQRIDVDMSGDITWAAGQRVEDWISLDGIAFPTIPARDLELNLGWNSRPGGFGLPTYFRQGALCMLSGVVEADADNKTVIGKLGAECAPGDGTLSFAVNRHDSTERIDILADGTVTWAQGTLKKSWLSLDGIKFVKDNEFAAGQRAKTDQAIAAAKARVDSALNAVPRSEFLNLTSQLRPLPQGFLKPFWTRLGDLCFVYGSVLTEGRWRPGALVATLPEDCRPASRAVFPVVHSGLGKVFNARVDVLSNGRIEFVDSMGSSNATGNQVDAESWLSLSGIVFPLADVAAARAKLGARSGPLDPVAVSRSSISAPVELLAPWENFGQGTHNATFVKQGEFCVLSGVVRVNLLTNWNAVIGRLPRECRPAKKTLVFSSNAQQNTHQIQVEETGRIVWTNGIKEHPWLSLDGIAFATAETLPSASIPLENEWVRHNDSTFAAPSYNRQGALCTLSGAFDASSSVNDIAASLPLECRPLFALKYIFSTNQATQPARFDLASNGVLTFVGPKASRAGFISLEGIRFINDPQFLKLFTASEQQSQLDAQFQVTTAQLAVPETKILSIDTRFVTAAPDSADKAFPSATALGPLCVLQGAFSAKQAQTGAFILGNATCVPASNMVVSSVGPDGSARAILVSPNGTISVGAAASAKASNSTWLSLDGNVYPSKAAAPEQLALLNGWRLTGGASAPATLLRYADFCVISGVVSPSSDWNPHVASLPVECQPVGGSLLFSTFSQTSAHVFEVDTQGRLLWRSGDKNDEQVSLNGIQFFAAKNRALNPLALENGFSSYKDRVSYRAASIVSLGSLCTLSGVVAQINAQSNIIARVPAQCRPVYGRPVFGLAALGSAEVLIEINSQDGAVKLLTTPSSDKPYFSLDGISYVVDTNARSLSENHKLEQQQKAAESARIELEKEQSQKINVQESAAKAAQEDSTKAQQRMKENQRLQEESAKQSAEAQKQADASEQAAKQAKVSTDQTLAKLNVSANCKKEITDKLASPSITQLRDELSRSNSELSDIAHKMKVASELIAKAKTESDILRSTATNELNRQIIQQQIAKVESAITENTQQIEKLKQQQKTLQERVAQLQKDIDTKTNDVLRSQSACSGEEEEKRKTTLEIARRAQETLEQAAKKSQAEADKKAVEKKQRDAADELVQKNKEKLEKAKETEEKANQAKSNAEESATKYQKEQAEKATKRQQLSAEASQKTTAAAQQAQEQDQKLQAINANLLCPSEQQMASNGLINDAIRKDMVSRWHFATQTLSDRVGLLNLTAKGPIRFEKGGLVLTKDTDLLSPRFTETITEKTLELFISLNGRLNQSEFNLMTLRTSVSASGANSTGYAHRGLRFAELRRSHAPLLSVHDLKRAGFELVDGHWLPTAQATQAHSVDLSRLDAEAVALTQASLRRLEERQQSVLQVNPEGMPRFAQTDFSLLEERSGQANTTASQSSQAKSSSSQQVFWDSVQFRGGRWQAGSEDNYRTVTANSDPEKEATKVIQIAITYAKDGRIVVYRNGRLYRTPYIVTLEIDSVTSQPRPVLLEVGSAAAKAARQASDDYPRLPLFEKDVAELVLGGGFEGIVYEARLYRTALSAERIKLSYDVYTRCPDIVRLTKEAENEVRDMTQRAEESRTKQELKEREMKAMEVEEKTKLANRTAENAQKEAARVQQANDLKLKAERESQEKSALEKELAQKREKAAEQTAKTNEQSLDQKNKAVGELEQKQRDQQKVEQENKKKIALENEKSSKNEQAAKDAATKAAQAVQELAQKQNASNAQLALAEKQRQENQEQLLKKQQNDQQERAKQAEQTEKTSSDERKSKEAELKAKTTATTLAEQNSKATAKLQEQDEKAKKNAENIVKQKEQADKAAALAKGNEESEKLIQKLTKQQQEQTQKALAAEVAQKEVKKNADEAAAKVTKDEETGKSEFSNKAKASLEAKNQLKEQASKEVDNKASLKDAAQKLRTTETAEKKQSEENNKAVKEQSDKSAAVILELQKMQAAEASGKKNSTDKLKKDLEDAKTGVESSQKQLVREESDKKAEQISKESNNKDEASIKAKQKDDVIKAEKKAQVDAAERRNKNAEQAAKAEKTSSDENNNKVEARNKETAAEQSKKQSATARAKELAETLAKVQKAKEQFEKAVFREEFDKKRSEEDGKSTDKDIKKRLDLAEQNRQSEQKEKQGEAALKNAALKRSEELQKAADQQTELQEKSTKEAKEKADKEERDSKIEQDSKSEQAKKKDAVSKARSLAEDAAKKSDENSQKVKDSQEKEVKANERELRAKAIQKENQQATNSIESVLKSAQEADEKRVKSEQQAKGQQQKLQEESSKADIASKEFQKKKDEMTEALKKIEDQDKENKSKFEQNQKKQDVDLKENKSKEASNKEFANKVAASKDGIEKALQEKSQKADRISAQVKADTAFKQEQSEKEQQRMKKTEQDRLVAMAAEKAQKESAAKSKEEADKASASAKEKDEKAVLAKEAADKAAAVVEANNKATEEKKRKAAEEAEKAQKKLQEAKKAAEEDEKKKAESAVKEKDVKAAEIKKEQDKKKAEAAAQAEADQKTEANQKAQISRSYCKKPIRNPASNDGLFSYKTHTYSPQASWSGWNAALVNQHTVAPSEVITGDFDGNGVRGDFAFLYPTMIRFAIAGRGPVASAASPYWFPVLTFPAGWNFGSDENVWFTLKANDGWSPTHGLDLNGDGKTDIVRTAAKYQHSFIFQGDVKKCLNIDGFMDTNCYKVTQFDYPFGWNFVGPWQFTTKTTIVGDFDGDKRHDFARIGSSYAHFFISKGDGRYFSSIYRYASENYGQLEETATFSGNFNNNCRLSFVKISGKQIHTHVNNGGDNCFNVDNGQDIPARCFTLRKWNIPFGWDFVGPWTFNRPAARVADFNGDGFADLVNLGGTYMHIFINKGDGTWWSPVYRFPAGWDFFHGKEETWATLPVADSDGDGKSELYRASSTYMHGFLPRGDNQRCWFKDGDIPSDCFRVTQYGPNVGWNLSGNMFFSRALVRVADITGDGRDDFILVGDARTLVSFSAV